MAEAPREGRPPAQHKYRFVAKKGSGAFSDVVTAQCVHTGELVAIKRMKATFKSVEQVTSLREIQALRRLAGKPFIVRLNEILFDRNTGRLSLIFELLDQNLYEVIKNRKARLPDSLVKWYMWQMLQAVRIAHAESYFHRDIKPENVLLDKHGNIKLADFGSARGIFTPQPYTEYISTRWYRSPECLLTDGYYGPEMDIFGLGCVMFEIIALFPLFPGKDETDQIHRIHAVCGTPSRECLSYIRRGTKHNPIKGDFAPQRGTGLAHLIPYAPPEAVDLMTRMLEYDPRKRISAADCLKHPYFSDILDIIAEHADTMIPGTLDRLGIKAGSHGLYFTDPAVGGTSFPGSPQPNARAAEAGRGRAQGRERQDDRGGPAQAQPGAGSGAASGAAPGAAPGAGPGAPKDAQPDAPPTYPRQQPRQAEPADPKQGQLLPKIGPPKHAPQAPVAPAKPRYSIPAPRYPNAAPAYDYAAQDPQNGQANVPTLPSLPGLHAFQKRQQPGVHPSGTRTPPNPPSPNRQGVEEQAPAAATAPTTYGHTSHPKGYSKGTYVSPYAQSSGQQLPGLQGSQYGALPPVQARPFRAVVGGPAGQPAQPLPGISGLSGVSGLQSNPGAGGAVGGGLPGHVARRGYPVRPPAKLGN